MNGNRVFDIPIYRLSLEKRLKEIDNIRAVYTKSINRVKNFGAQFGELYWENLSTEQRGELRKAGKIL